MAAAWQAGVGTYWNGYDKDTAHDLRSATKSITSLLVGIALDNQMLSSVSAPISDYLSAAYPGAPALKRDITVEHLLTMSSRLACDDWNDASPNNENKMYKNSPIGCSSSRALIPPTCQDW